MKAGSDGLGSEQIASTGTPSVVYIEVAWNLIDSANGRTLSQVYVPNVMGKKNGKEIPSIKSLEKSMLRPVFVQFNGAVEPVLSTDDGADSLNRLGETVSARVLW